MMRQLERPKPPVVVLAYAFIGVISLLFIYPYLWMFISSFRETEQILTEPLRLLPEALDISAYADLARLGGVSFWTYAVNSLLITGASTALTVMITALGAYALVRKPKLPGFRWLRFGFLLTIMYPYMLLVIPVYLVVFEPSLHDTILGNYTGIILFLSLGPIQFFLFEQFFRSIPREIIDAAIVDGAGELQVLTRVVLPVSLPVVLTVTLVTFLLNWSQWFPVLVISRRPDTYTLPVALLNMNSELGTDFQGIMALATITTIPVLVVFLLTQRRVMSGMAAGAVKG